MEIENRGWVKEAWGVFFSNIKKDSNDGGCRGELTDEVWDILSLNYLMSPSRDAAPSWILNPSKLQASPFGLTELSTAPYKRVLHPLHGSAIYYSEITNCHTVLTTFQNTNHPRWLEFTVADGQKVPLHLCNSPENGQVFIFPNTN